jgi:di/tricarboxylate transporter
MATAILIAILIFVILAFALEWMPIDQVALVCLGLLLIFNLITPQEAIAGFSNPAVITVMMMFIVSEGLVKSGLLTAVAHRITGYAGNSRWTASTFVLTLAGVMSAFINNTAAMSLFMPVSIHLAKHYKFSPSKILLPLSYASILGGTCTLIGTSTNLLVSAMAEEMGYGAFSMFELASLGLILFGVGMVYTLTVSMRLLPPRASIEGLMDKYHLSAFLTELRVPEDSKMVGRTVFQEHISERFRLTVLEILRGSEKIAQDLRNTRIRPEDILIVRASMEDIVSFKTQYGLLLLPEIKLKESDLNDESNILAEVQLSPVATLEGSSLKDIDFRRRFGCFVLALNRTGEMIHDKVAMIPLKRWDTLLVFGPRARVEALSESDDFVSLEEKDFRLGLSKRWWIGALIVVAVVGMATLTEWSILKAALVGAVAMVMTRCLRMQEAYKSINWTVIFLIAAILPLGTAMQNTGLAAHIGTGLAGFAAFLGNSFGEGLGPWFALALIYLATTVLTEIMSNNTTVVLMAPIAVSVALGLQVNPHTFLMAVTFAGSAAFLTPMGYNTNAMCYGPGAYRFMDYIKSGIGLKVLFWILSTVLIPVIWKF